MDVALYPFRLFVQESEQLLHQGQLTGWHQDKQTVGFFIRPDVHPTLQIPAVCPRVGPKVHDLFHHVFQHGTDSFRLGIFKWEKFYFPHALFSAPGSIKQLDQFFRQRLLLRWHQGEERVAFIVRPEPDRKLSSTALSLCPRGKHRNAVDDVLHHLTNIVCLGVFQGVKLDFPLLLGLLGFLVKHRQQLLHKSNLARGYQDKQSVRFLESPSPNGVAAARPVTFITGHQHQHALDHVFQHLTDRFNLPILKLVYPNIDPTFRFTFYI